MPVFINKNIHWIINLMHTNKFQQRPCQARRTLVDTNSNETIFYPFAVSVNKCAGSCNSINDPRVQVSVSNKVKNMNAKIFNLMSGVNETRFVVQHESCECI